MDQALMIAYFDPVGNLLAELFDTRIVHSVALIIGDDVIEIEHNFCLFGDLWIFAQVCIVVNRVAVQC